MDTTSPHLGFVIAAYAVSAVVLAGSLVWVLLRKHRLEAEAARVLKDGA